MTALDQRYQKKIIDHWRASALKNWADSDFMFNNKRYDWSLFIAQLTIEKILKALVVKFTNELAPPIHDLEKLANLTGLKLTPRNQSWLKEITTFNIEARYDDIKMNFYKKATRQYSTKWINNSREIIQWLEKQFN